MRWERRLLVGTAVLVLAGCGSAAAHSASRVTAPPVTTSPRPTCTNPPSRESTIMYDQLPPATKAQVDRVRAVWAHKYPTGADATKAGWWKSTTNLYGIGAHYVKGVTGFLSVAQPVDLMHPNALLYDGDGPNAKFVGVSYITGGAANAAGFAGCYDFFHSHKSVCIGAGGLITLTDVDSPYWYSESQCRAHGFKVLPLPGDKMLHLWIGPDYLKVPIFGHDNRYLYNGYYPKRST